MKFGHQLLTFEQAAPKELQGHFLQYKFFKKLLKRRLAASGQYSPRSSTTQALAAERDFLRLLRCQLKDIDKKFAADAEAVLSQYDSAGAKGSRNTLAALLGCKLMLQTGQSTKTLLMLQQKVFWIKKYAQLNALALRKIAKKRDKLCGGQVGQGFVQACFNGKVQVRALLSAPLLRELTAVEQLLCQQLSVAFSLPPSLPLPAPDLECTVEMQPLTGAVKSDSQAKVVHSEPWSIASAEQEQDFNCPICLDVLYQPVALECGHIYCARCAISTAVGHDRSIGDTERLLTTIAAYSAVHNDRPCPACRSTTHGVQAESVFWQMRRMTHLDKLIKQKFPEDWQRRREEDEEDQAKLKAERPKQRCLSLCCS